MTTERKILEWAICLQSFKYFSLLFFLHLSCFSLLVCSGFLISPSLLHFFFVLLSFFSSFLFFFFRFVSRRLLKCCILFLILSSVVSFALRLPLALNSASFPQLTPTATGTGNELTQAVYSTWLYNCLTSTCFSGRTHLHRIQPRPQVKVILRYLRPDAPVSLFFRLFTQVHLLIDGSVEGQYVTYSNETL